MGQKINPTSFRLGVNQEWNSVWASSGAIDNLSYSNPLTQDILIRKLIHGMIPLKEAYISNIHIKRNIKAIKPSEERYNPYQHSTLEVTIDLYIFQKVILDYLEELLLDNKNDLIELTKIKECITSSTFELPLSDEKMIQNLGKQWTRQLENKIKRYLKIRIERDVPQKNIVILIRNQIQLGSNYSDRESHFLQMGFLDVNSQMIAFWMKQEIEKGKGIRELLKKIEKAFYDSRNRVSLDTKKYRFVSDGVKISCSGRFLLMDNEKRRNKMARRMTFQKGVIALTTVTNLVNYSSDVAYTLDGTTGIKAWISYSNSIKKIRIGF